MDRDKFGTSHFESDLPRWPCPRCERAGSAIRLVKKSVRISPVGAASDEHSPDSDNPQPDTSSYFGQLECDSCRDVVFLLADTFHLEVDLEDDGGIRNLRFVSPAFFEPTLPIINLPDGCPRPVREKLREAFALYWRFPSAAANAIRVAIELLLDERGFRKDQQVKTDRGSRLSLHTRIEHFSQDNPSIGRYLLAVKWLGNHGSHGEAVKHKDVLDALELIERTLGDLYPANTSKLRELANRIIAANGPTD